MRINAGHVMAASAVLFLSGFAFAAGNAVPAAPKPASFPVAAGELAPGSTVQLALPSGTSLSGSDFDALSEGNDPLFREGSKELLQQELKASGPAAPAAKPVLRDAPNSGGKAAAPARGKPAVKPQPVIKKPAPRDHGPADPVKTNNLL